MNGERMLQFDILQHLPSTLLMELSFLLGNTAISSRSRYLICQPSNGTALGFRLWWELAEVSGQLITSSRKLDVLLGETLRAMCRPANERCVVDL